MITPLDITKQEFRKVMRGYDAHEVDEFLEIVSQSFKELMAEKSRLLMDNENFKNKLKEYESIDKILRETLITVQKTAEEIKRTADREAESIINKARVRSEEIILESQKRKDSILNDIENLKNQRNMLMSKIKAFLTTQYELLKQEDLEI